ncbi:leucine-rich repeat-containing protein 72-like isoform X2 [Acanthaster planci]|uniref:Leucine-rich repeat-containing protein 72-like isoform X2 n=1 Tax=Acanthaster planci TaxID=133434 RepID=A0A8B7YN09_ACAPL|nr:leucine-rich repeat-containing protein 72-like isoform X2 [Acanthaster planci]
MDAETGTTTQLIKLEMDANGIRKDLDVTQIYLAQRNLEKVESLGCYRHLNELWLNGNKLRQVTCLRDNFQISHLYLQDNELVCISKAISHLSCLKVLMLHNNQLTKLGETINEMRNMQALHTLTQEKEYRLYVIFRVPSLELLDRKEVQPSERAKAFRRYKPDEQRQLDSVAFGRRCRVPSIPVGSSTEMDQLPVTALTDSFSGSDDDSDLPNRIGDGEYADNHLAEGPVKRSVMQYSHFDWSKVPRAEERRLNSTCNVADKAQIITVRFR